MPKALAAPLAVAEAPAARTLHLPLIRRIPTIVFTTTASLSWNRQNTTTASLSWNSFSRRPPSLFAWPANLRRVAPTAEHRSTGVQPQLCQLGVVARDPFVAATKVNIPRLQREGEHPAEAGADVAATAAVLPHGEGAWHAAERTGVRSGVRRVRSESHCERHSDFASLELE